jgi:hypothetical protein
LQINHDIHVSQDDKIGDITCVNCSVYVRGLVSGDILTVHGNVIVEQSGQVAGDVAAFLGSVHAEDGSRVAGDIATLGGSVRRSSQASVAGDVASLEGGGWGFLIFALPLAFFAAIIALVIWLVRRGRRPLPVAA